MIWQPCKYNWDCATLMGLLPCLRVLTWSHRVHVLHVAVYVLVFWEGSGLVQ